MNLSSKMCLNFKQSPASQLLHKITIPNAMLVRDQRMANWPKIGISKTIVQICIIYQHSLHNLISLQA